MATPESTPAAAARWQGRILARVNLPLEPPIAPMLAKLADALPAGDGWLFEPKWDGFRAIVFRDGAEWLLQSRDGKPLNRYFPELEAPLLRELPERCIVDGEIVIAGRRGLDFEALLLRIHPAASRVALLAQQTPASFVAWDLLALGGDDLTRQPQGERRARVDDVLARVAAPIHVTPATHDRALAADWFERFEGAGLDGVIAKPLAARYEPGKRTMLKLKHARTADCVVGGFRWHKDGAGEMVGSLLLGLYDAADVLHHVGIASSFTAARRRELVAELAPLRAGAADGHPWAGWMAGSEEQRMPGATSRWNRGKDLGWEPLRIERACEVAFDHMQGSRFRHPAQFRRWRPDKRPADCRYDQLDVTPAYELAQIFARP
jgi:ATP-dependent DNA ligase